MNITNTQMLENGYNVALGLFQAGKEPNSCLYIHRKDSPWDIIKLDLSGRMGLPKEAVKLLAISAVHKVRMADEFGGCLMIVNGWTLALDKDTLPKGQPLPIPSESPDRKEALCLLAWDMNGVKASQSYDIVRDEKGAFVSLGLTPLKDMGAHFQTWIDSAFTDPEKILKQDA